MNNRRHQNEHNNAPRKTVHDVALSTRIGIEVARCTMIGGALLPFAVIGGAAALPLVAGVAVFFYLSRTTMPDRMRAQHGPAAQARLIANNMMLRADHPAHERVAAVAKKMNMNVPDVFLNTNPAEGASISVTDIVQKDGTLRLSAHFFAATSKGRGPLLTPDEQEAVLAHEMAHLRLGVAGDSVFGRGMTTLALGGYAAAFMVYMINPASFLISLGALGFATSYMGRAWLSRRIEKYADETAVRVTKNPLAMATALSKIKQTLVHAHAFDQSARGVKGVLTRHFDFVLFQPKENAPAIYAREKARFGGAFNDFMQNVGGSHPGEKARYRFIRRAAQKIGITDLPQVAPQADTKAFLPVLPCGTPLPPFALYETLDRGDADNGVHRVSTLYMQAVRGERVTVDLSRGLTLAMEGGGRHHRPS